MSGSYLTWIDNKKKDDSHSEADNPLETVLAVATDEHSDRKQRVNVEMTQGLFESIINKLSRTENCDDKTAVKVSPDNKSPVESTLLISDTAKTRSGRNVKPANRLQLNKVNLVVLTTIKTENVHKGINSRRDESKSRSGGKNRNNSRDFRKDKYEKSKANNISSNKNRGSSNSKGKRHGQTLTL
jgi:hypothetical protein